MSKEDIFRATEDAGIELTEVEKAALQALANDGKFDGLEYRTTTERVEFKEEISTWFPSVWQDYGNDEMDDITKHYHLYKTAPFPIISGVLVEWLLTEMCGKYLRSLSLTNIKVSDSVNSTRCNLDCDVVLTDCIVEGLLKIAGKINGGLTFNGFCGTTLVLSGDISNGVYLNDVQCRQRLARGFGGIYLNGLKSPEVKIYGAYIPHDMIRFRNSDVPEIEIRGRGLECEVRLDDCKVGNIDLYGWTDDGYSIPFFSASGTTIEGRCNVSHIQGVLITETVVLKDLTIADVRSTQSHSLPLKNAIMFSGVEVKGTLSLEMNPNTSGFLLSYQNVRVQRYEDRPEDINAIEKLEANGLTYQELAIWEPDDTRKRIEWLLKQPKEPFPVASWQRVAAQFRRRGKLRECRKMLIKGEQQRRYVLRRGVGPCLWSWLLRKSIGYGWETWRIGLLAMFLIIVGTYVASFGMDQGLMSETSENSKYVSFNPIVYSIDEGLPIIDLRHSSLWLPSGKNKKGQYVQYYFWFHTVFGWIIATLFVIGFTGVARKIDEG